MRYSEVCELGVVTGRNLGMLVGEVKERLSKGYEFLMKIFSNALSDMHFRFFAPLRVTCC
jgi:hypothetical protein